MYLLDVYGDNLRGTGSAGFICPAAGASIPKWTVIQEGASSHALLKLAALALADKRTIDHLAPFAEGLWGDRREPLHVEFRAALHREVESVRPGAGETTCGGIQIMPGGRCRGLRAGDRRHSPGGAPFAQVQTRYETRRFFLLAYGAGSAHHDGTDDFGMGGPHQRAARVSSLFDDRWKLTDPKAFLDRLNFKGARYKRVMPFQTLSSFCRAAGDHLGADAGAWMVPGCDYDRLWDRLDAGVRAMLLPLLDACRRMAEAFPRTAAPAALPGVFLFHRPDLLCPGGALPAWLKVADALFPRLQFVVTLPASLCRLPFEQMGDSRLPLPEAPPPVRPAACAARPHRPVVLVDVDGKLPNLALMKLCSHFRKAGREVVLLKKPERVPGADGVYASCLFHTPKSLAKLEKYRALYGDAMEVGGSGVDIALRLPGEIESLQPDYSLYPEFGDRAIGFLTRGCPNACGFCIVPAKEGAPRQVSDLDALLQGGRNKLVLLDDNLLAHPESAGFLDGMARRGVQVNFNQSLDIRFLDEENAAALRRVRCANSRFTRENHYFGLNDANGLDTVARNYRRMGFSARSNVEFLCIYGFSTTLAEDVERLRFLRSLPGAYAFVQRYQQPIGGPPPADIDFFGDHPDRLIDALVRVCFPQNMKSVETYYRWVSRKYAERFGALHMGLVDAIFCYNNRSRKGDYIASLANARKLG